MLIYGLFSREKMMLTLNLWTFLSLWWQEDSCLQEPKLLVEVEQPPPICAFFAGFKEAVDVGPCTLAQHLNRYGHDVFTKLGQENDLEATL